MAARSTAGVLGLLALASCYVPFPSTGDRAVAYASDKDIRELDHPLDAHGSAVVVATATPACPYLGRVTGASHEGSDAVSPRAEIAARNAAGAAHATTLVIDATAKYVIAGLTYYYAFGRAFRCASH